MLRKNLINKKKYFGVLTFLTLTFKGFSGEIGVVYSYHYSKDTPLFSKKRDKLYSVKDSSNYIDKVNLIRKSVNLIPLSKNSKLEEASKAHIDYLILNGKTGHYEDEGDEGFVGVTPMDRGRTFGYEPTYYSENLTVGFSNISDSIDALMQSIYHRFGFLDFYINEIGIANKGLIHNYNMGNQGDIEQTVDKNPAFIVWPPENYNNAQVSFANFENPNPLSGEGCVTGGVTGNPISIQFNPHSQDIIINSFKLFSGNKEIPIQTILTFNSDPNSNFRDKEFALFPAQPLEINTRYRVVFNGLIGGEEKEISWSFKTRNYSYDRYRVKDGGVYRVKKDKTYIVQIVPNDCTDDMNRYEYQGDADVEFLSLDIVKITPKSDIHFKNGTVEFDLIISDEDSATPAKLLANGDSYQKSNSNSFSNIKLTILEESQKRTYILSKDSSSSKVTVLNDSADVAVDKIYNTLNINLGSMKIYTGKDGNMSLVHNEEKIIKESLPLGVELLIDRESVKYKINNMPDRLTF